MKKRYVYTVERWGQRDFVIFASSKLQPAKDLRDSLRKEATNPEEYQVLRWVEGEEVSTLTIIE